MVPRITSYNVCYTKLLREAGLNLAQTDQWNWSEGGYKHFNSIANIKLKLIYKKKKLAWESLIDNELGVLYSSELVPRITSYNVCYTKLLRKIF